MTINFYTSLSVQINPFFLCIWHTARVFIVFNNSCFRLAPGDIQELSYVLVAAVSLCSSSAGLEPGHSLWLQVAPFVLFLGVCLLGRELELFSGGFFCFKSSSTVWQGTISPLLSLTLYLTSGINFPPCLSLLAEQPASTGIYFPRWCLSSLILCGFLSPECQVGVLCASRTLS